MEVGEDKDRYGNKDRDKDRDRDKDKDDTRSNHLPILTAGQLFWVMEVGEDKDKYENKDKDRGKDDTGLNHLPILTASLLFWVMEVGEASRPSREPPPYMYICKQAQLLNINQYIFMYIYTILIYRAA